MPSLHFFWVKEHHTPQAAPATEESIFPSPLPAVLHWQVSAQKSQPDGLKYAEAFTWGVPEIGVSPNRPF